MQIFFIKQHMGLYQQRKQLFLKLPGEKLQSIVPVLEASEDINKFIQTFLRSTLDYVIIDRLINANVGLAEKIWKRFAEWIRKPETAAEWPKEMLQEIQEDFPKEIPKKYEKCVLKAVEKKILEEVQKGMVSGLLTRM